MNTIFLFLGGVGMQEILVIGLVVLVFFGSKKIPEFMKGLGKGVREFKDGVKQVNDDVQSSIAEPPKIKERGLDSQTNL